MTEIDKDKDEENVINMAEARQRQQTLRRKGASKKKESKGQKKIAGFPILSWLQFGLFLLFFAYFMQQCRH